MNRRLWVLLAVGLLLIGGASAADVVEEQSQALGLDKLEQAAGEYSPPGEVADIDLNDGLKNLLDTGSGEIMGVIRKAVRSGVLLLVVVLLCGLAEGACAGAEGGNSVQVVPIVGALAITEIGRAHV